MLEAHGRMGGDTRLRGDNRIRAGIGAAIVVGPVSLVVGIVEFLGAWQEPQWRRGKTARKYRIDVQHVALTGDQAVNDEAAVGSQQSLRQLTRDGRGSPSVRIRNIAC